MFGKRCALKKKIRTSGGEEKQENERKKKIRKAIQIKSNQIISNQMYEIKFY